MPAQTQGEGRPAGWRLIAAGALALVYALPLFWPPGPAPWLVDVDAPLAARLFPGVPALWVFARLLALAVAALLLAPAWSPPGLTGGDGVPRPAPAARRGVALAIALAHAGAAPWAVHLGPGGQLVWVLLLAVPPLLLAAPSTWSGLRPRAALPVASMIAAWVVLCLLLDQGSPRVANAVDGWRGIVDIHHFVLRGRNLLTDLLDPELPGLGAGLLLFLGLPLFQAGVLPVTIGWLQVFQVVSLAVCAAGVGVLTRRVVGPGVAIVAVAVFLFSPFLRFVALFPGPFLAGSIYATAMALCAWTAARHRSEAALAGLGTLSAFTITFPGAIPFGGLCVLAALWRLRRHWRQVWIGLAAGLAGFVAVAGPALTNVLTPARMGQHLGGHGIVALLEPVLLGQEPLAAMHTAREVQVARPADILVGAGLMPFANPRLPIRLWGDALFDPVGASLLAVALVACARSARRSAGARLLLTLYVAAVAPAFVSPVDIVDVSHAAALPVPVAVLAAAGFAALQARLVAPAWRRAVAAGAAVLIAGGGTLLFDVVNPRLLPDSSTTILLRALRGEDAARVVVLDYPARHAYDVRWLFTGAMATFAGPQPLGFLEFDGGPLPAEGLAAEGRDLLAWSPGLERDGGVAAAVCAQWPRAELLELGDASGLSRVHVARLGARPWQPAATVVSRHACD